MSVSKISASQRIGRKEIDPEIGLTLELGAFYGTLSAISAAPRIFTTRLEGRNANSRKFHLTLSRASHAAMVS
jgi:hypothetical protein